MRFPDVSLSLPAWVEELAEPGAVYSDDRGPDEDSWSSSRG